MCPSCQLHFFENDKKQLKLQPTLTAASSIDITLAAERCDHDCVQWRRQGGALNARAPPLCLRVYHTEHQVYILPADSEHPIYLRIDICQMHYGRAGAS